MSRYRWLPPSKCLETMDFFPSVQEQTYEALEKLLFDAVSRGDVRAMLNDELVPKVHIPVYLSLYARVTDEQGPHTLPPNLALNYDDLCAVFDRPTIDNRKRGRPVKERSGWSEDRRLAFEMHKMLSGPPDNRRAQSAAEAARILVDEGRVSGAGAPENRAKRLERAFRKYYST
ncbi:MAG: hypothetical protein EVA34_11050 [Erythrobacter sp.]|nr:MAG: hypothetical protein EVA34_11050 [Erythrobacter sp.]